MKKRFQPKLLLTFLLILMVGKGYVYATIYTVTTTTDNTNNKQNTGTLRWAITQANGSAGLDTIQFNLPNNGTNTFESTGTNSWAVLTLVAALPAITDALLLDGYSQINTNTGLMAGKVVGVSAFTQTNINYPDIYIVCGYSLPSDANGLNGNGLSINAPNVTVRGLAISGFGNTSTNQPIGSGHADISVLHSTTARTMNTLITDCFLSCDPRGAYPALEQRRTKGNGLLILANNNNSRVKGNYVAHSGSYGIVFHASQNNSTTNANIAPCINWIIEENQVINIGRNSNYVTSGGRAADGISMMTTRFCLVRNNYVEDWEQFGIDLGHSTDDNRVENNTLTGFTKTIGSAPCGGVRTGFSSERDSIIRNEIYNNTTATCLGGIWADESLTSFSGGSTKSNNSFYYFQNSIHDNTGSGITLSNNGNGTLSFVTISQNSSYNNSGLGIDLNFNGTSSTTSITLNDDGDGDAGINDLQNFPIIDSVRYTGTNLLTIWGKGPATSTMEFFVSDGQWNKHGGLGLNYGEGRTFIGSAVEGSSADGVTGTGSYNIDGNIATNNVNLFRFTFPFVGFTNADSVTATATLNRNTSEFGPRVFISTVLGCNLLEFSGGASNGYLMFNWQAICDNNFSHFIIEESKDSKSFWSLGLVKEIAVNKQERYKLDVAKQITGNNYYRLKMVDRNGTVKYSNIIQLKGDAGTKSSFKITPSLVADYFVTQVSLERATEVRLSIINASGNTVIQKVFTGIKGDNAFMVNELGTLGTGIYMVDVIYNGQHHVEKIMKR